MNIDWNTIALITAYLGLPAVVSILIYIFAPGDTFITSGTLRGWKVNATGAFGSYVFSMIMLTFIFKPRLENIGDSTKWVRTLVKFKINGSDIDQKDAQNLLGSINITFNPPDNSKRITKSGYLMVKMSNQGIENRDEILYSLPGFMPSTVCPKEDKITETENEVDVGEIVLSKEKINTDGESHIASPTLIKPQTPPN
jgi:hypothetical protein